MSDCEGQFDEAHCCILRDTLSLIVGDIFAIGVLLAVIVATVFALGFGATSDLVGGILILGLITSFVESNLRAKNRGWLNADRAFERTVP